MTATPVVHHLRQRRGRDAYIVVFPRIDLSAQQLDGGGIGVRMTLESRRRVADAR